MRQPIILASARACLFAALYVGGTTNRLPAQDTAVVFVHGIKSSNDAWNFMLATLQPDLRINPVLPTFDWTRTVAQQADSLQTFLNNHPATSDPARRMPFVGHSNGGLDSREYSRIGGRLRQVLTIGTPHGGAYLANSWLSGNVLGTGLAMADDMVEPVTFFANEDMAIPEIVAFIINSVPPFLDFAIGLHDNLCYAGFCLVEVGGSWVVAPVIFDLAEGSTATTQLNTEENRNREAAVTTHRVGIRTAVNPQGAVFDLLGYHAPSWVDARDILTAAYMLAYDHYRRHWDPFLQMNADLWVLGAAALIDMDANWQWLTGTLLYYELHMIPDLGEWYTIMVSDPSDGVVPTWSQQFPGGTRNQYLEYPFNISHTDQMTNADVREALKVALRQDFEIPPRQQPPQPPVSWTQISGPSMTRPGTPCHWTATSNSSDATYEWFVNDASSGSGPDFYHAAQSSFTLRVTASGGGGSASDSRSVEVNPAYGACLEQD